MMEPGERVNREQLMAFKRDVVSPLLGDGVSGGVATLTTGNSGKSWRPLNVLGTTLLKWGALKPSSSSAVSSVEQDKLVLKEVLKYVQFGALENKYGLSSFITNDHSSSDEEMTSPPTTRRSSLSSSSSSSSAAALLSPPQFRSGNTDHYSPIQQREARLPLLPTVFQSDDMALPVAAIIEYCISDKVKELLSNKGGSSLAVGDLGGLLWNGIHTAFHEAGVKNPLKQGTVTRHDLGCLARRVDIHHNRAAPHEHAALAARVRRLRAAAVQQLHDGEELLGYDKNVLAPAPDMPLLEYYRAIAPFRKHLQHGTGNTTTTAKPFDYTAERFPARMQGFAVQKNMSHKSAAILRAIMYETHVSQTQFMLQWSYWHLFFLGEAPSGDDLRTSWTLRMRFQQLDERDRELMINYLNELIVLHPEARFAYMSDATHFANGERLVRQLTFPFDPSLHAKMNHGGATPAGGGDSGGGGGGADPGDDGDDGAASDEEAEAAEERAREGDHSALPGLRSPRTHFLSIGDTSTKAAADTADACVESIITIIGDFALRRLVGGTVDHAALSEIRHVRDAAVRRGVSPMSAVLVALGDDFHKTALVMKHLTKGSFGTDHKIGAFHHVQTLHNLWYVIEKDSSNLMALMNKWAGHEIKKRPKEPQPQRWNTIGACSDDLFDLKKEPRHGHPGQYVVPDFFKFLATKHPASSGYLHSLCCDIALHSMDERIIVGLTMESEVNKLFWERANTFNRQKSSQGYDVGFRGRDMPPEVMHRRNFWEEAVADPSTKFPRTWAAIQAISNSNITMPAADDQSHGPLDTAGVKALYERKLSNGIAAAKREFEKLYACWDEAPLTFWWLCAPNYAPACARAILKISHSKDSSMLPDDFDIDDVPAAPAGGADDHFSRAFEAAAAKDTLTSWVKELRLLESRVRVDELLKMAASVVTLTDTDTDTLNFSDNYKALDDWLFYSMDVLPTTNLICELSFSQIKAMRNKHETQITTDMKMRYHQNVIHVLREERKRVGEKEQPPSDEKKKHYSPNDTKAKVICAAQQLQAQSLLYDDDHMDGVLKVNQYKRRLMKDVEGYAAQSFTKKMMNDDSTKEDLSEEDWGRKRQEVAARALTSDTQQSAAESETKEARTAKELQIAGHWNELSLPELRVEVKTALPRLYTNLLLLPLPKEDTPPVNLKHLKRPFLLRLAKGLTVGLTARIAAFIGSNSSVQVAAYKGSPLFLRPATSSTKAVERGKGSGDRFRFIQFVTNKEADDPEKDKSEEQKEQDKEQEDDDKEEPFPTGKKLVGRRVQIKWRRRWQKGTVGRYHVRHSTKGVDNFHCHSFVYDVHDPAEYVLNLDGDGEGGDKEEIRLLNDEDEPVTATKEASGSKSSGRKHKRAKTTPSAPKNHKSSRPRRGKSESTAPESEPSPAPSPERRRTRAVQQATTARAREIRESDAAMPMPMAVSTTTTQRAPPRRAQRRAPSRK